jgi:large subunit ribosomal protein L25
MENLKAEIREGKIKDLNKSGYMLGVLYGPEIKETISLKLSLKEFKKVLKEAGESSLISLKVDIKGKEKEFLVLLHEIQIDHITGEFTHVDFYQPILTKEVEAEITLVFEGESTAVKEQGGTLVKEIQTIKVKALPQKLPHEIKVNIEKLKTFEDEIFVKDLIIPEGVKVLREPDEIVAVAMPPQKIEEELAKPVEEDVEKVGGVEKAKEEVVVEEPVVKEQNKDK